MDDKGGYPMDDKELQALTAFSRGDMTALESRPRLGGPTYGEVLILLGEADLPPPHPSRTGREEPIERARERMFRNRRQTSAIADTRRP